MGHAVGHLTYEKDTPRGAIIDDIYEIAMHGDGYDASQMHWHSDKVYDSIEDAQAAIERMDKGFYDDHAVLYLEYPDQGVPEPNKTEKAAIESLENAKASLEKYVDEHHVYRRQSELIGCVTCNSKVARAWLTPERRTSDKNQVDRCPVCGADLRPPSTLERIAALEDRIRRAEEKVKILQDRRMARWHSQCREHAKTMWLVKYEYHC